MWLVAAQNSSSSTPDWLLPLVLIVVALLTGLAGWGIYEATAGGGDGDDASVARQLELYTACLNDHGANVPLVETRSDGGFAIIVPGSLLDHEIDLEQWRAASEECQPLEPNPLELLSGLEDLDMSNLAFLFGRGFDDGEFDRRGGGLDLGPRQLRELCRRLERGDLPDDINRRELREVCELIDA